MANNYTILSSHNANAAGGGPGGPGVEPVPPITPGTTNPWDATILTLGFDDYTNANQVQVQVTCHTHPDNATDFDVYQYIGTAVPTDVSKWGTPIASAPMSPVGDTVITYWVTLKTSQQNIVIDVVANSETWNNTPKAGDYTQTLTIQAIAAPAVITQATVGGTLQPIVAAQTAMIGGLPSGRFRFVFSPPAGSCNGVDCNYRQLHVETVQTDSTFTKKLDGTAIAATDWTDTFQINGKATPVIYEQPEWFPLDNKTALYYQVRWRSQSYAVGSTKEWSSYSTPVNITFPKSSGVDLTQVDPTSAKIVSQTDLLNGTFDQGTFGWSPQIGWALDSVSGDPQSGVNCLKWVIGSSAYAAWLQQWGPVNPGDAFAVEGWSKCSVSQSSLPSGGAWPSILMRFYTRSGSNPASYDLTLSLPCPTANVWNKSTGTIKAPDGTGGMLAVYSLDVFAYCGASAPSGATYYMDSIRVYNAPNAAVLTGLGATMDIVNNQLVVKNASLALAQMAPGGMTNSTFLSSSALDNVAVFANGVLSNNAIFGNAVILNANIGDMSVNKLTAGSTYFQSTTFGSGKNITFTTLGAPVKITVGGHGYSGSITGYIVGYQNGFTPLNGTWTMDVVDANTLSLRSSNLPTASGAFGNPVMAGSGDPTVVISNTGVYLNNARLSIIVTNGGKTYQLATNPQTFDSSYGSLALQISNQTSSPAEPDLTSFISRGVVAYYNNSKVLALVRNPSNTTAGSLVLYADFVGNANKNITCEGYNCSITLSGGSPNNKFVILDGVAGTVRADGGFSMAGNVVIDASRNFTGAGVSIGSGTVSCGTVSCSGTVSCASLSLSGTFSAATINATTQLQVGSVNVIDSNRKFIGTGVGTSASAPIGGGGFFNGPVGGTIFQVYNPSGGNYAYGIGTMATPIKIRAVDDSNGAARVFYFVGGILYA